ncbi:MAG: hypothetical protein KDB21_02370, partial [Acidimicrobiales bacterium]|nr:hypothetical protein [Acidimicrobiales bacterium]
MRRLLAVVLSCVLLAAGLAAPAAADPGDLDAGFGASGVVSGGVLDTYDLVAVDDASGAILVAGTKAGTPTIARLLADGAPDTTFAGDGGAEFTVPNQVKQYLDLRVTDDGSIIVVGISRNPSDVFSDVLFSVKLSGAGAVDSGYGTSGIATESLAFVHLYDSASVGADGSVLFSARGQGVPANSWSFAISATGSVTTGPTLAIDLTTLPTGCSVPDGFTPGFGAAAIHRRDAGTFAVLGVTSLVCNSVVTDISVLSIHSVGGPVLWSHFLPEGEALDFDGGQIPLISDGDHLLFSTVDSGGSYVRRVDATGDAAAGWGTAGRADAPAGTAPVGDLAVLPNGDVAVLSGPSLGLSSPDVQVAALNPDGTVDSSFGAAAVSAGDLVATSLAATLDGALLVSHVPVSGTSELRRYQTALQSAYLPLSEPVRLADTRATGDTIDDLFQADGMRPADSTLELTIGGRGGIPTNAATVILNITAVTPQGPGFITVHPCGTTRPLAASLVYSVPNISNSVTAKLGTNNAVCIYTNNATHLVVDA